MGYGHTKIMKIAKPKIKMQYGSLIAKIGLVAFMIPKLYKQDKYHLFFRKSMFSRLATIV